MTTTIDLHDLNQTESEVLANIVGLDYPQKLKDRVTNLTRRAFRYWRALLFVEQLVERRKKNG
jgi:hypothetical protein